MDGECLIGRLQAQLRASADAIFEREDTPSFACYFNPDDAAPHANVAIPVTAAGGDLTAALDALVACFVDRVRTPRIEYLEPFAPMLAPSLTAYGFVREDCNLLMVCTPASYRPAPAVERLEIMRLGADSSIEVAQDFVTVQSRAFGDDDAPAAMVAEAVRFRTRFQSMQMFLAQLDGAPVAAGSLTKAHDGVAEVAGISTLTAYRRRGVAAALTAHIARHGLSTGLDALFLTAADEAAGRVYQRVGFEPYGHALAFRAP